MKSQNACPPFIAKKERHLLGKRSPVFRDHDRKCGSTNAKKGICPDDDCGFDQTRTIKRHLDAEAVHFLCTLESLFREPHVLAKGIVWKRVRNAEAPLSYNAATQPREDQFFAAFVRKGTHRNVRETWQQVLSWVRD